MRVRQVFRVGGDHYISFPRILKAYAEKYGLSAVYNSMRKFRYIGPMMKWTGSTTVRCSNKAVKSGHRLIPRKPRFKWVIRTTNPDTGVTTDRCARGP